MKLIRCPSCRTVNRVGRFTVCHGCDRNLQGLVAKERAMPAVLREAERDGAAVWIVLGVLACFSVVSMSTMVRSLHKEDFGTALFTTATSLGLVGALLWLPMKRRIDAGRTRDAVGCGGYILSLAAAAFGAAILVFLTCVGFG